MSYLPYGNAGPFSWIAATGSSVAVHGGVLAIALGGLAPYFDLEEKAQPYQPDYTITLEQLDSDILAGLVERQGIAGAEGETPPGVDETAPDVVNPEAGEQIAALEPELAEPATAPAVDESATDEAETTEPDKVEALPEVETVDPLPDVETIEALPELETVEQTPDLETIEPLPEPETLAALPDAEQLQPLPEPETLAALPEPETLEPLPEPEALGQTDGSIDAVQPVLPIAESVSPIDSNPLLSETPTALLPEAAPATNLEPVIPSPVGTPVATPSLNSTAEVVSAAPRVSAAPVVSSQNDIVASVRPTESAPLVVESVQTAAAVVAPPNTRANPATQTAVPRAPAPLPSAQDLAIGELLGRIRTSNSYSCLIALPRRDGEDGVGLALISASDSEISEFVDTVLTEDDASVRQTRTFVDPRQCPALSYVRQNRDYPATRLGVRIDSTEVPTGGRLTGTLRGTAGKYVMLLLVDNNGVVQDLQRFLSFSGNFVRFDVPVTRVGPPRDTSQLLLAIATQRPPNVLRDRAGQLVQDVLAGLEGELATGAALTITTFDVR